MSKQFPLTAMFPSVEFTDADITASPSFVLDNNLGFVRSTDAEPTSFVGFGAPYSSVGGMDNDELITPITGLRQLHPGDQTVDKQGKGVGPRMYNTPEAALGTSDIPDVIGAYIFALNLARILDMRRRQGGTPIRILRHASRMVKSRVGSLDGLVDSIHRSFGDAEAVLYSQPPRAALRQECERRSQSPPGMPAEFMIVRHGLLRKIGTVAVEKDAWTSASFFTRVSYLLQRNQR